MLYEGSIKGSFASSTRAPSRVLRWVWVWVGVGGWVGVRVYSRNISIYMTAQRRMCVCRYIE
jgi:hypothetical protein